MPLEDRKPQSVDLPVEYRAVDRREGVLTILTVPYGEVADLSPFAGGERFVRGAFRKAAQEFRAATGRPWLLFRSHEHGQAIGRATKAADTPEGLLVDFRLGRRVREEVMDEIDEGLLPAASVGFRSITDRMSKDGVREVLEAAFLEASLCPIGAYAGAGTVSVRTPAAEPVDLSAYLLKPPPEIDLALPFGPFQR